jgi:hypothetical protein
MLPAERIPVLQAFPDLLAGLFQRLARPPQGLLHRLSSLDPGLFQRPFLILGHLPKLLQGLRHLLVPQPRGQLERQVEVLPQPELHRLVGRLAALGHPDHLLHPDTGQVRMHRGLPGWVRGRAQARLLHGHLGRVEGRVGQTVGCRRSRPARRSHHQTQNHHRLQKYHHAPLLLSWLELPTFVYPTYTIQDAKERKRLRS